MYVCMCRAVTDSEIAQAIKEGAKTLKDLRRELGVSGECGLCADCAKQCLRAANQEIEEIESSEQWQVCA